MAQIICGITFPSSFFPYGFLWLIRMLSFESSLLHRVCMNEVIFYIAWFSEISMVAETKHITLVIRRDIICW